MHVMQPKNQYPVKCSKGNYNMAQQKTAYRHVIAVPDHVKCLHFQPLMKPIIQQQQLKYNFFNVSVKQ